jgi:tetratricopeptide (TPR) repeat protein
MTFDRHQLLKLTVIIFLALMGCEAEYGEHPMVDLEDEGNALDVTYVSYLQDQIVEDPSVSDNYVKLASIYIKQEKVDDALGLLQKGAKETDGSVNVLVELGQLYLEQGNIDQLSVLLRSFRNADPDNIDFLKLSAGYALLLRDYTNAIFFANRAMLTNPLDDENMFLQASAKLINKDSVSALNAFLEAYKIKKSFKNFKTVFELSLALDQTENARNYLLEFEKLNSEKDFCYQWGAWYNTVGKSDSARLVLLPCTEALAGKGERDYELARTYFPYQTDSVLAYLNRSLDQQPNSIRSMVLKAKTLERLSNYEQAKNIYQSAIELDSTSTLAIEGLNNLERKVAYLRLVKRKESVQKDLEILKPLNSKTIN